MARPKIFTEGLFRVSNDADLFARVVSTNLSATVFADTPPVWRHVAIGIGPRTCFRECSMDDFSAAIAMPTIAMSFEQRNFGACFDIWNDPRRRRTPRWATDIGLRAALAVVAEAEKLVSPPCRSTHKLSLDSTSLTYTDHMSAVHPHSTRVCT